MIQSAINDIISNISHIKKINGIIQQNQVLKQNIKEIELDNERRKKVDAFIKDKAKRFGGENLNLEVIANGKREGISLSDEGKKYVKNNLGGEL